MRTFLLFAVVYSSQAATFREAAKVIEQRCASCHAEGGIGPMPLTSYAQIRPYAAAIRQSVAKGNMPPWHADEASSRHIANARLLSASEKETLLAWLAEGAKDEAGVRIGSPEANSGWRLGKPDIVLRIPGMKVPAQGTLEYAFLVNQLNLPKDTWIAAAEWKIDQKAVVHHINAFTRPKGSSYVADAKPGEIYVASRAERAAKRPDEREIDRRELLLGYEPGYLPQPWGSGRAKLLKAGADIIFEMHYTANGKELVDHSELGLYIAKEPVRERVLTITPADANLEIPPGVANYESKVSATLLREAKLVSLQPHMHLRGKAYEILLNGEPLLRVPRYDFNWQTTYFLKKEIALKPGAVLSATGWFDNSANNRYNPDPTQTIRWGDQSWEEMNVGFMEIAIPANADPDVVKLSGTTRPQGGRQ